ncbi:hypothetical protein ElyMa_000370300 [Elysia marginata]|uniref:Uncharacterized protein n=1 Tax=Elysia marginata TaxID=1093978 RepID=A0AAV4FFN6_9GAST|nr:hypothetical protein ElyMa_000370300 [Elysia marginata]
MELIISKNALIQYDSDDAGLNDDYGGIDTDDDDGNDTDDDSGNVTDDDSGNVTDDDDDGDISGPPIGSNSEPGLQERAALHGRRMTKAWRPHTHESLSPSLSGHSHCMLTASQYRSRQTARSVKYQRRQGFFLTYSCRPSIDGLPGLLSSHRPLTQVTLSAKSKTAWRRD